MHVNRIFWNIPKVILLTAWFYSNKFKTIPANKNLFSYTVIQYTMSYTINLYLILICSVFSTGSGLDNLLYIQLAE